MFYTKKHFAGINLTNETLEIVILEKRGRSIRFTSAEKCSKDKLKFSDDVNQVYKKAHSFGALKPEDVLCHSKQISGLKWWEKKRALNELKLNVRALSESESAISYAKGHKEGYIFHEARRQAIEDQISSLKSYGYEPNGLSSFSRALVNFATYVCEKEDGILLNLEEDRGYLIAFKSGQVAYQHAFECNMMENCEEIFQQLRFALCAIEGQGLFKSDETLYITGPASFDIHLVSFLRAALCRKIVHPELSKSLAPANLCHSFSVSLGLALEASLSPSKQLNFRLEEYQDMRLIKRAALQEVALASSVLALLGGVHVLGHTLLYERDRSLSMGLIQETVKVPCTIEPNVYQPPHTSIYLSPKVAFDTCLLRAAGRLFCSGYLSATIKMFQEAQKEMKEQLSAAPVSLMYPGLSPTLCHITSLPGVNKLCTFQWDLRKEQKGEVRSILEIDSKYLERVKRSLSTSYILDHCNHEKGKLEVHLRLKPRL